MEDAITPLRWEGDELCVLDQRRLPEAEIWLRCRGAAQVADCIRSMAVRGAPAIGLAAAYGVALAARSGEDPEAAAALLRSTRPTAVNLTWAVDQAVVADDPLALAMRLHREQRAADRRMSELGAERFEEGDRALTHCNTGGLRDGRRGAPRRVGARAPCPGLGGRDEAAASGRSPDGVGAAQGRNSVPGDRGLGSGRIDGTGLVDRVVVGADRIAANGDVANKIGTYPVAVLAARHRVPFYVAAPLSTIDHATPSGDEIAIEERDPAEVSADGDGFNPAFDVTPAELVTAVITEAGILEPPYERSIARARG